MTQLELIGDGVSLGERGWSRVSAISLPLVSERKKEITTETKLATVKTNIKEFYIS